MPTVTRELKITYGSFVVGGTTDRLIHGIEKQTMSYDQMTFGYEFVIAKEAEDTFNTEIAAVEAAYHKPLQQLKVEQGSETLLDLDPSTNSGFNQQPILSIVEGEDSTGRSRKYSVTVTCGLPADLAADNGRRDSRVSVQFLPSQKRILTISGVYTALSSDSALTVYKNNIAAYVTSVQGALASGTWDSDPQNQTFEHDKENKVLSFSRVYEELIFNQSSSLLDNTSIVQQSITINLVIPAPGDTPDLNPRRLQNVIITADMFIDKSAVAASALEGFYTSTIKPYLAALARSEFGVSTVALVSESATTDKHLNRIQANMQFMAQGASDVVSYNLTVKLTDDPGKLLVPVWDKSKYSKHVFDVQGELTRITTRVIRIISGSRFVSALSSGRVNLINAPDTTGGDSGGFDSVSDIITRGGGNVDFGDVGGQIGFDGDPSGGGGGSDGGGSGGRWVIVNSEMTETPLRLGTDTYHIDVIDRLTVIVERWADIPSIPTITEKEGGIPEGVPSGDTARPGVILEPRT